MILIYLPGALRDAVEPTRRSLHFPPVTIGSAGPFRQSVCRRFQSGDQGDRLRRGPPVRADGDASPGRRVQGDGPGDRVG